MALVAQSGDAAAGAVYVKIVLPGGTARLYAPAPMGFADPSVDRDLTVVFEDGDRREPEVDAYMREQTSFDPDLWLVEVEHCREPEVLHRWLTKQDA